METQTSTNLNKTMMQKVFISADALITPFGVGSDLAFQKIKSGQTAIQKHFHPDFSDCEFYASLIQEKEEWLKGLNLDESYTRLEKLVILCLTQLIEENSLNLSDKTLVVLSSTKGNISILNNPKLNYPKERAYLNSLTKKIEDYFQLRNPILIVSNACISGSLAIEFAKRQMELGEFENAIVIGADEVS